MKNKFIIILIILIQFLYFNKIFSKEIQFSASEIEVVDEGNETIAKDGTVFIQKENVTASGKVIRYIKNKSLLIVNNGNIKKINDNLEINSNIIQYYIDQSSLYFKKNVIINDNTNQLKIRTNELNYNLKEQKIKSKSNSEIRDKLGNIYRVDQFEYYIKDKIIKLINLEVLDISQNLFKIEMAFLNLEKKELIAKDVGLNFKISANSENEPRLKGRSLVTNKDNTIVKKELLLFVKKGKNVLLGK